MAHSRPAEPWRKVGMDLFHLTGKDYLVIVDYQSNYPELALLPHTTANEVIKHCKAIIARHGIPVTVVSDNGPQFSSGEFRDFAETYGFEHVTSSPLFPQSNGLAEKAVQIVKRLLKKAAEDGSDPFLALLNYRASPLECGQSPAELLMHRKLRTRLPSAEHLLEKRAPHLTKHHGQNKNYNRMAKQLCPLKQYDVVRVRCDGRWGPLATVMAETAPRSYVVKTEFGNELRRNRRHLLKVPHTGPVGLGMDATDGLKIQPGAEPASSTGNGHAVARGIRQVLPPPQTVLERPRRHITKPKRLIEEC